MWKNKSEETMAKMVLIEAHPLLRLGLWQILSELDDIWEIQEWGGGSVQADATQSEADLLIYGLPTDPDLAVGALSEIQSVLSPKRILLLSDIVPLPIPMQALPVNAVCGCLPKTAPVEVLEAAIRLVMAGGQCFPGEQALQPAIAAGYPSAMRVTNDGVKPTMPISTGAQLLQITPRQYEVLVLLARGYPIKTVSRMLQYFRGDRQDHACTLYQRLM